MESVVSVENVTKGSMRYVLKIYMMTFFQILLFVLVLTAAFIAGMVDYIGPYLIPLLDKTVILGTVMFYASVLLGLFSISRFLLMPYIMLSSEKYLDRHLEWGLRLGWALSAIVVMLYIIVLLLNSTIEAITELVATSANDLSLIAFLLLMTAFALLFWWKTQHKALILFAIAFILIIANISGSVFMQYLIKHEPDFVIVYGDQKQESYINIIYKSGDGVLTFENASGLPIFFPWHEIKEIKVSPSRSVKVRERQLFHLGFIRGTFVDLRRKLVDLGTALRKSVSPKPQF